MEREIRVDHEYMPNFLKGKRPQYFNKGPLKVPSKHAGKIMTGFANRKTDGKLVKSITKAIKPEMQRYYLELFNGRR
ncbi:MAG: hypothetical protein IPM38_16075 [Ignavibacteria bacterium]|nr:hypothetical protein [Ignavibacteria bacterium]